MFNVTFIPFFISFSAKIMVFFLIFYGCLAAFFASMLTIFMTTVPEREDGPKMTRYLAGKQGLDLFFVVFFPVL